MTPDTLPLLTTQAALHECWRTLMGQLGFSQQSLWFFAIGPDDRAVTTMAQIDEMPREPGRAEQDGLGQVLAGLVDSDHRLAFLISRPGRDGLSVADRRWAAALVAACREAGVAHETIHRANDVDILPVTLDDLPSGAIRIRPV